MPDLIFHDLRGGRNGIDSPLRLPENQCADALNVDWFTSPLGRKRGGSTPIPLTGDTAFSGSIVSMFCHNAGGDGLDSELWAIDNATPPVMKRTGSYAFWRESPFDDPILSRPQDVAATSHNGKFFTAYDSGVNRLHVHDVVLEKTRRVGLAAPGIPTIADTGVGTYEAVERWYRVRVVSWDGSSTIIRRSEPSAAVRFTPSGTGAAARITLGTVPGEGEDSWEVDVSLDNEIWFSLFSLTYNLLGDPGANTATPIATTFRDDTTFPGSTTVAADYLDLEIAEEIGLFTLPPAARFVVTDGNRLLMAGSYIAGQPTSRVWFTPVLGAADHGDDERVIITDSVKGYVDLNEKDGGEITGMAYAAYGVVYVFKLQQTWKLTPTGIDTAPYLPKKISNTIGCLYHKTIVQAEDASGNPVVGFLSLRGPARVGIDGLVACGRDVDDIWFGLNNYPTTVNVNAATMIAHGIYYGDRHQIWWYLTIDDEDSPSLKIMMDVRQGTKRDQYGVRGGWARHTGKSCRAICSVMAPEHVGTADASRRLVPYISVREPV